MRIILNQKEIEEAIEADILAQVNVPEDHRIDIDLKATRGDEGYQAFIDIVHVDAPIGDRSVDDRVVAKEGAQLGIAQKIEDARKQFNAPRRRGRPAGSLNKTTIARLEAEAAGTDTVEGAAAVENETTDAGKAQDISEPAVAETVTQTEAEPIATTTGNPDNGEVVEAQAEPVAEAEVEEEAPAPAATVQAEDVTEQASEELVAHVSDAPEEIETISETEVAPAPEEVRPTRSLFGDLKTPTNNS